MAVEAGARVREEVWARTRTEAVASTVVVEVSSEVGGAAEEEVVRRATGRAGGVSGVEVDP